MSQRKSEITERLFDELRALGLPPEQFVIFGSGPMGVRGLREIRDVDVIVAPALFAHLATRYPVEDHDHGLRRIQVGNVEILDGCYPDIGPIDQLIAGADIIDGLPFAKLEKVLEWKGKYGRDKDRADIEAITRYRDSQPAPQHTAQSLTMEQYLPILRAW
jgi:hypothetical protein